MANERATATDCGLGTFTWTATRVGAHNIKGKLELHTIDQGSSENSQVVVSVNLNGGSAFFTSQAGAKGFETGAYLNVGDVLNVVITSSATIDQSPKNVKHTISFY